SLSFAIDANSSASSGPQCFRRAMKATMFSIRGSSSRKAAWSMASPDFLPGEPCRGANPRRRLRLESPAMRARSACPRHPASFKGLQPDVTRFGVARRTVLRVVVDGDRQEYDACNSLKSRNMDESTREEGAPPKTNPADRLDSWKEIASYLKRGISTVQR